MKNLFWFLLGVTAMTTPIMRGRALLIVAAMLSYKFAGWVCDD